MNNQDLQFEYHSFAGFIIARDFAAAVTLPRVLHRFTTNMLPNTERPHSVITRIETPQEIQRREAEENE
jgi:hypothetical protein